MDDDLERARTSLAEGRAHDALEIAESVVEATPNSVEGLELVALANMALKRYASATVAARSAVQADPARAESHRLLAEASVPTSAPDSYALNAAREAIRLDPFTPAMHVTLGNVLLATNRRRAASNAYAVATRLEAGVAGGSADSHAIEFSSRIAVSSLILRIQVILWACLIVTGVQINMFFSGEAPNIAILLLATTVVSWLLVALAVWRYRVVGGSGAFARLRTLPARDKLLTAAGIGTFLGSLLILAVWVLPVGLGLAATVLAISLVLLGVRRMLR